MKEQNVDFWPFDKVHPKVNVPTCNITGWYDRLVGTIDNYVGMVNNGPERLRNKHRLIVGPWGHATMGKRQQGPLDFGPGAEGTYADELIRWYDYVFKGVDNGLGDEPPVKLFIMGEDRCGSRTSGPWRAPGTRTSISTAAARQTPSTATALCPCGAGDGPPDRYDYDPKRPGHEPDGPQRAGGRAGPVAPGPPAGRPRIPDAATSGGDRGHGARGAQA